MAWIESHQTLEKHRKLISLSNLLGIPKHQAIGHLHCLWWWAIDNAPTGDISGCTPSMIAEVSGWFDYLNWWQSRGEDPPHYPESNALVGPAGNGNDFIPEAGRFVAGLQICGFLDGGRDATKCENEPLGHGASIHDWLDFCGDLVKKRIERKKEKLLKTNEIRNAIR